MTISFPDPEDRIPEEGDVIRFHPREVSDVVNRTPDQTDHTHHEPGFAGEVVDRYLDSEQTAEGTITVPYLTMQVSETEDPDFFEKNDQMSVSLTAVESNDYIEWKRS